MHAPCGVESGTRDWDPCLSFYLIHDSDEWPAPPRHGGSTSETAKSGAHMALTDTFLRQVKHTGKAAGDKHTDGGGMYLLDEQWRRAR